MGGEMRWGVVIQLCNRPPCHRDLPVKAVCRRLSILLSPRAGPAWSDPNLRLGRSSCTDRSLCWPGHNCPSSYQAELTPLTCFLPYIYCQSCFLPVTAAPLHLFVDFLFLMARMAGPLCFGKFLGLCSPVKYI